MEKRRERERETDRGKRHILRVLVESKSFKVTQSQAKDLLLTDAL